MGMSVTSTVRMAMAAMLKGEDTNQIYKKPKKRHNKKAIMLHFWWLKHSL
jgi:hypothetical protein